MSQRTTLTLEDDVVARLRDASRRTGKPFKAVVNDAIRTGLAAERSGAKPPFRIEPRPMGLRPGMDLDDISGLLERLEGPEYR
jgi:hypothetical protein